MPYKEKLILGRITRLVVSVLAGGAFGFVVGPGLFRFVALLAGVVFLVFAIELAVENGVREARG